MTKHQWTPEAVHELVKDWPDLARASIGWAPGERQWVQFDGTPLLSYLAAAAHVASGLEWLADRDESEQIGFFPPGRPIGMPWDRSQWCVCWDGGKDYEGPTLLHAVSAAIMAAGGVR
jgi:hypothetical protein